MLKIALRKRIAVRVIDFFLSLFFWPMYVIRRFRRFDEPAIRKILIPDIHGLGDVVLATQVFRAMRKKFPHAFIAALVKPESSLLLKEDPNINEIITYDFPWVGKITGKYRFWEWDWRSFVSSINNMRCRKFDLLVDSRMDFRTNLLYFAFGARFRFGYAPVGGNYAFTHVVKPDPAHQHRTDEWEKVLKAVGISESPGSPRLYLADQEIAEANALLEQQFGAKSRPRIGIHPGGRAFARRWSPGKIADVVQEIRKQKNVDFILFDDSSWKSDPGAQELAALNLFAFSGTLRQFMAVVAHCDVFLCNDGGQMHIADALGVRVVSIFGPGNPAWFYPYNNKDLMIITEGFACRPCYDNCIFQSPKCIESIESTAVLTMITGILIASGTDGSNKQLVSKPK